MAFGLGEFADPLHEGERLLEIVESKRPLDAVGIIAQFPIRHLLLETQRFIARKRRNAAATRRAGFFRESLGHVVLCNLTLKLMAGRSSAIDLSEHDVERADDRRDIGQHMPAAQEIHRLQMAITASRQLPVQRRPLTEVPASSGTVRTRLPLAAVVSRRYN